MLSSKSVQPRACMRCVGSHFTPQTDFVSRTRVSHHRRLKKLHDCLQEIDETCDDKSKCSAAKAAFIECDVIIKMHQQLAGDKLLPMRLERSDLDEVMRRSE